MLKEYYMCIAFWKKKKAKRRTDTSPLNHPGEEKSVTKSESIIVEEVESDVSMDNEKNKVPKYHVSQNKKKDTESYLKWRVRKESSDKTIQFFDTQKHAIDYAQELASQAKTTVVIHKLDGSIRKQDYSKKE